jgi:hypothetical protein
MLGYEANLEIVILILVLLRKKTIRKVNSQMKQLHILTVLYNTNSLKLNVLMRNIQILQGRFLVRK